MWTETLYRVSCNDPSLKWIDAMCFLIGDSGCRQLADALTTSNNSCTKRLNLRLNRIGWEGTRALTNALLMYPSVVVELNLGANDLRDKGAFEIATFLQSNRTLTKLSLIRCNITASGMQAIAISIRHNSTLTWLNVADNHPGEDTSGVTEMITTLEMNPTLRYLQIDSPDRHYFVRVNELVQCHCKIYQWNQLIRGTMLIPFAATQSQNDARKVYPYCLSKIAQNQFALGIIYGLVKDFSTIFVGRYRS
ncbi:hypothetical protein HJC23_007948 [Cyclotella cryptica]|uniref:Uncharacterized protein n=1 Tax=Cyclotella cryptica TaxID=29204 RepID=A0ABD3PBI2_9STRA|eukprot:CCRYP_016215-RA/>CCRYP_016215-RA protein AED:0.22 eAED:0.22 QI:40/1/1/1/1/1/2/1397/249